MANSTRLFKYDSDSDSDPDSEISNETKSGQKKSVTFSTGQNNIIKDVDSKWLNDYLELTGPNVLLYNAFRFRDIIKLITNKISWILCKHHRDKIYSRLIN